MRTEPLAYTLGPISGAHVNPAVTVGFVVSGRMAVGETIGYWVAQFVGGVIGAVVLWAIVSGAPGYSTPTVGLGTDGWERPRCSGSASAARSLPRSR